MALLSFSLSLQLSITVSLTIDVICNRSINLVLTVYLICAEHCFRYCYAEVNKSDIISALTSHSLSEKIDCEQALQAELLTYIFKMPHLS